MPRPRVSAPPPRESAAGELLRGVVERVTYRDPDSRYTVIRVTPEPLEASPQPFLETDREILTAVGPVDSELDVSEGARIVLRGSWETHPRHGRQFRFQSLESLPPLDKAGLVRYLSSTAFRGIGPVLAERIVERLGPAALERIDREPEVLAGVRGLPRRTREGLVDMVRARRGARELHSFLLGLELSFAQVRATVDVLGPDAEAKIRRDPYVLARGVRGIGFPTADRAARRLGLAEDSQERRRAALVHVLELAAADGHTLLVEDELFARVGELLERSFDRALLAVDLDELARARLVALERVLRPQEPLVYLPALATSETELARNLARLLRSGPVRALCDDEVLRRSERAAGLRLHADQRAAVQGLLREPVALLTGGPGVGKTTIVRLVVELAESAGLSVLLASPTGRAAKRLSEATGRAASTVHRLLGWEPAEHRFQHDARRPIEADLVVVDEISMLDVTLAHHLVKSVQPPTRLVLVGDPDQLPSVSAGNVLADLIASGRVPVYRLSQVFRQESAGLIVENAHRILQGELPRWLGKSDPPGDFYFFPADGEGAAADRLIEIVTERIPARFGLDWVNEVQVLSPMYRGACGVDALNARLRDALGLAGAEVRWRDRSWRVGDRVIQTRNDYDKQVFNGDMGRIARVEPGGPGVVVKFPEREVPYRAEELTDLQCAFAITVHRSQGGEFPAVVMPLVTQHFPLLQRNLLYTAITRAKRLVVLVGSSRALSIAVENSRPSARASALADRLRALLS